jgi:hypothetical protein
MADWLVGAQKPDGLWHYTFAFGGQPIPWWSSMAQSQAVSLLLRAHQETGLTSYLDHAGLAIATMRRPHGQHGVAMWDGGRYWLEEYMPPYSRHTLNGFIFSIEGLREWQLATGDSQAGAWMIDALATLRASLARYDTGSWSTYNLAAPAGSKPAGSLASLWYHVVHVMQLRHVASTWGDATAAASAARWAGYVVDPPAGVHSDYSPDDPWVVWFADPLVSDRP